MIVPTIPSKIYAVTSAGSCTVTSPLPSGGEALLASIDQSGGQCSFAAPGSSVTVSDDAAVVLPLTAGRSLASASGNGASGGGSSAHVIQGEVLPDDVELRNGDELIFVPAATSIDLAAAFAGVEGDVTVAFSVANTQAGDLAVYEGAELLAQVEPGSQLRGIMVCSGGTRRLAIDGADQGAAQAAASASAAAISAAEAAASAALAMEGAIGQDAMMALARSICFAKAPFPEEFLMAAEATTESEWRSLAPNSYAINGADQEVYVEYHPNSEGGKVINYNIARYYYLVTQKTEQPNSGVMCRGKYNFIWNLDASDAALRINSYSLDDFKFWFVYVPNSTRAINSYNCVGGRNASVVLIAPKLKEAVSGLIRDSQAQIAGVATKHYIRCYLPSLNKSCSVAPYHRALAGGVILTLGSLPDVTGNSTRPTITMGLDPDAVASIAEDGSMTFVDEQLQTAVDAAVAKGWTVAFNVTPLPESTSAASAASLEADSASPAAALNTVNTLNTMSAVSVMSAGESGMQSANAAQTTTQSETSAATATAAKDATQLWYHAEASDYGDYLNAVGQRVAITSAKGVAGAEQDGSWRRCGSADEAAAAWGLTHDPLESAEPEAAAEASAPSTESSTDTNGHEQ